MNPFMKTLLATLCLSLCTLSVLAQTTPTDGSWRQLYSALTDDDDMESGAATEQYEWLDYLAEHPLNLNRATRTDLERLPFLTARQVEDVMEYADRYGPVRSVNELAMVQSLDMSTVRLLACFVYAGDEAPKPLLPPVDTLLHRLRGQLTAALQAPLYTRDGYLVGAERGYLGPKYRHWLRFRMGYGRRIEVGLTAAQDAGEPFFTGRNRCGYDFYSAYAVVRDMGLVKEAVAGRYRARWGMGLVLNTDFSFGKASALASVGRTDNRLRPHSSRSEATYLQGAAATLRLSAHMELTALASYRSVDATLNDDGTVKTLLATGYHRTASEMQRRRNTHQTATGASLVWHGDGFRVGLQGLGVWYDRCLSPDTRAVYRRYDASGRHMAYASAAYAYTGHAFQASGETAIGPRGAWAALHTVSAQPCASLSLTAVHRYYSYRYHPMLGNAFGDSRDVSNEHGLYAGASYVLTGHATLSAYTDWSWAAWPRYGCSWASRSSDHRVALQLAWPAFGFTASYRVRMRQHDNADHTALDPRLTHRLKLQAQWQRGPWRVESQAHASAYSDSRQPTRYGLMLAQGGGVQVRWCRADAHVAWFHTHDYDTRLYMYERGLLYDFSFPMFYGHGLHYALRLRAQCSRRLMLMAKFSTTDYFDRPAIGTGLQRIGRSSKSDVEMQAHLTF